MRLLSVDDIEEDMVIGKSIYNLNGKLLFGVGLRINPKMKAKLVERGYSHVHIMDENSGGYIPEKVDSSEVSYRENKRFSVTTYDIQDHSELKNASVLKATSLIDRGFLKHSSISYDMKKIIMGLLKEITPSGAKIMNSVMIKTTDSSFLDHALNVTLISLLIGLKYHFAEKELYSLGLGSFLHDIGKIIIKQENDTRSKDDVKALYSEHPFIGHNLLVDSALISPLVTQIINQHHEQQDGSGFPLSLIGQNNSPATKINRTTKGHIFRFAEVCSVANAFDNLAHNQMKQNQVFVTRAIKQIMDDAGTRYNRDIVKTLVKLLPYYPVGSAIKVTSIEDPALIGYTGVIAKSNEDAVGKPVIILTKNKYLQKIKPIIIDTGSISKVELQLIF